MLGPALDKALAAAKSNQSQAVQQAQRIAMNPTELKVFAIRQYRPAFFEGFENETVQFNTLEEMLAIPWVKNFAANPDFYRFSISDRHLMAEYRAGREWRVVGFLRDPNVGLPAWEQPKT